MKFLSSRRARIALIAVLLVLALLLILIAAFPLHNLKPMVERRLSDRFGRPVTIGTLERETAFSWAPIIRVADVKVPQAAWAGQGMLASIDRLRFRLPLLPLLIGRVDARLLDVSGVRLDLVRAADGRTNWGGKDDEEGGGGGLDLTAIRVENAQLSYRDAKQKRDAMLRLRIDPRTGLVADGTGHVDGAPVTLGARGGALVAGKPWPFTATIEGPRLAMRLKGSMAEPLRADSMAFHVTARADDLKRIDRVIEAGLFGTRAIALTGDVRHQGRDWFVDRMAGTIGQSRFAGHVSARKVDGRVKLDGAVRFAQLNFEDLASESGNRQAVVLEREQGLRLVPNTRIDIHKMHETDGRIAVRADRILAGRRPSSLTAIEGVLAIDHLRVTIDPLRIGLPKGAITGRAVVDQRDGAPSPLVTLALDMTDSSIGALAGGGDGTVEARVDARVRLTGRGDTIRAAVGRSDGSIGIVARNGVLPEKIAALMGFDIGKGLLGGDEGRATLRCAIVHLAMKGGRGTLSPLLIDTSLSQARGTGTIRFPEEAIAVTLTGAPKDKGALRVPGMVNAAGTIREPRIVVPRETKSVGNVLKAIGRAISGDGGPLAKDADCATLARRAMAG